MDRRVANPLVHFPWTRAFVQVYGGDAKIYLLAARRDREFAALAPLVKKRQRGICRFFLAGIGELHEPMDLAWTDRRALDCVLVSLVRGGTPLVLERILADSPSVSRLKRAYRGRAIVITRPQASCPYIALDESWIEPETHLSARGRGMLRRARREAEQLGPVTTEIHAPDLSELEELLDTAFEVEAASRKGDAGTALLHDPHQAAFYRQYAASACVEGTLRICFLRIGDRVAAMQLAVEEDSGFWLLKAGYDVRFAACSPGMLLTRDTIRYAVEAGLKSYEFLGRSETRTRVWTATEHACVSLRVYPLGVRGLSALAADAVASIVRKGEPETMRLMAHARRAASRCVACLALRARR